MFFKFHFFFFLCVQLFCEDGSPRLFHNVAKNGVFSLMISQTMSNGSPLFKFANMAVQCTLVYDQNCQKAVEIISQKPMEYRLTPMLGGTQLKVDVRIKVLSSQFGGSLFRIFIQFLDRDKRPIPDLTLYSHPIRVRSKLKSASHAASSAAASSGTVADTPSSTVPSPQKRSWPQLLGIIPGRKNGHPTAAAPPPLKRERRAMKQELVETCSPMVKSEDFDEEFVPQSQASLMLQLLSRIEKRQIQHEHLLEHMAQNTKVGGVHSASEQSSSPSFGSPDEAPSDYHSINSSLLTPSPQNRSSAAAVAPSSSAGCGEQACYASHQAGLETGQLSFSEKFLNLMTEFSQMSDETKQAHVYMIHNYADAKQQQSIYSLLDSLATPSRQSLQPLQNDPEAPSAFSDEEGAPSSSSPGLF